MSNKSTPCRLDSILRAHTSRRFNATTITGQLSQQQKHRLHVNNTQEKGITTDAIVKSWDIAFSIVHVYLILFTKIHCPWYDRLRR